MKLFHKSIILLFLGVLSAASFGGTYSEQVNFQLAVIKLSAIGDGWTETHNDKFAVLSNGGFNSFDLVLKEGRSYRVIAVCDEDCSDLDLVLYDENDNEISRDQSRDSIPQVTVSPRWTGRFKLHVVMYSCRSNPCYYGISVLGR